MDRVDMTVQPIVVSVGGRYGTFSPRRDFRVSPSPSLRDEVFRNSDDAIANRLGRARWFRQIGRPDLAEVAEADAKRIQRAAETLSAHRVST